MMGVAGTYAHSSLIPGKMYFFGGQRNRGNSQGARVVKPGGFPRKNNTSVVFPPPTGTFANGHLANPANTRNTCLRYLRGTCMIGSSFVAFGGVLDRVPVRCTARPSAHSSRVDVEWAPRCAGDPRRMGPAGGGIQRGRFRRSEHFTKWGPQPPHTRSAPKRAMRCAKTQIIASRSSTGMKEPWAPLANPRPRDPLPGPHGPCGNSRHARPRGPRRQARPWGMKRDETDAWPVHLCLNAGEPVQISYFACVCGETQVVGSWSEAPSPGLFFGGGGGGGGHGPPFSVCVQSGFYSWRTTY
jgi:hypothetical protein